MLVGITCEGTVAIRYRDTNDDGILLEYVIELKRGRI